MEIRTSEYDDIDPFDWPNDEEEEQIRTSEYDDIDPFDWPNDEEEEQAGE